jgi:primary-amine oxidase
VDEINAARDVILAAYPDKVIFFRETYLQEPPKSELTRFLEIEHSGRLSTTSPRPARLAKCQYDVVGSDKIPEFHEAIVDIGKRERIHHVVVGKQHHAALTLYFRTSGKYLLAIVLI